MTGRSSSTIAAATVLAAVAVLAGPVQVAVAGGLLLALLLPGLALTRALFRRRDLSGVERAVLAPAMSLACLIIAGLLMNAMGVRLDRAAWTTATVGVTLLSLLAAAAPIRGRADRPVAANQMAEALADASTADTVRLSLVPPLLESVERPRRAIRPDPAARTGLLDMPVPVTAERPASGGIGWRPVLRHVVPLALAVALAGAGGWLSYDSSRDSARTVTALSASPPSAPTASGTRTLRVTADGLTPAQGPYTLVVRGDGDRRLSSHPVTGRGGSWSTEVTIPGQQRVTIGLYRAGEAAPYRLVIIAPVG